MTAAFDNRAATAVPLHWTALYALAATVAFLALLWPLGNTAIGEIFLKRGWVPYVLTFMMMWSFIMLAFKWVKLRGQRAVMHFDLLPSSVAREISEETVYDFEYHINSLDVPKENNFLVTRLLRGLAHFEVRKNHAETASMLASQSEIDATTVQSSYTLIQVFIWAIPILGFIGTVIGISEAVSEFGTALQSTEDTAKIREGLGSVTNGLGLAFDTTLLALIMSLLVMFPTSMMQKLEEDILNQVDEYTNEHFLKRLNDRGASVETAMVTSTIVGADANGVPPPLPVKNGATDIARFEALQSRITQVQESQIALLEQLNQALAVEEDAEEEAEESEAWEDE